MTDEAPKPRSLDAIAALVAANVTPLAGVLFLGWHPGGVVVSYFVDTFVGFGVVLLLVMVHVTGDEHDRPIEGWKAWTKAVLGLALVGAIFALPLGFPLYFVLHDDARTLALLQDRGFQAGIAVQVLMSLMGAARVHRQLVATHDDEKILAARTMFLAARWFVVSIAGVFIASALGPRFGSLLLVAVYAGASVYFELDPGRAMRFVRGKDAKPLELVGDLDSRAARKRRRR